MFDSLKDYFFVALADNQVSNLAIFLLKGFIQMENIQANVLKASHSTLLRVLGLIYSSTYYDEDALNAAEEFLKSLYWNFQEPV